MRQLLIHLVYQIFLYANKNYIPLLWEDSGTLFLQGISYMKMLMQVKSTPLWNCNSRFSLVRLTHLFIKTQVQAHNFCTYSQSESQMEEPHSLDSELIFFFVSLKNIYLPEVSHQIPSSLSQTQSDSRSSPENKCSYEVKEVILRNYGVWI